MTFNHMKKLILGLIMCITLVGLGYQTAQAQELKREGKTFIFQKSSKDNSSTKDIKTSYSWQDSKGNVYPIYLHQYVRDKNAGKWTVYVNKKSEKTGKVYKYYIPNGMQIAEEIINENPNIIK